jgi:hypothetical protein
MAGNRQTQDLFSVKTRNLVLLNSNGSFPTVGTVLVAGTSGQIVPTALATGVSSIVGGTGITLSGSTGAVTVSVGPIYGSTANAFVVGATSSGEPAFRVDTSTNGEGTGVVVYSNSSDYAEIGVAGPTFPTDLYITPKGAGAQVKIVSNNFSVFPYEVESTTPTFNVVNGYGAGVTSFSGLQITSNPAGSGCVLTATSSATDEPLEIYSKGSGQLLLESDTGRVNITADGGNRIDIVSNFGPVNLYGSPVKIQGASGVSGGYTGYMNLSIESGQIVSYTNKSDTGAHGSQTKWLHVVIDGTTGYIPVYN